MTCYERAHLIIGTAAAAAGQPTVARGRSRENEWRFHRDNRSIIDDFRSTKCSVWRVAAVCPVTHARAMLPFIPFTDRPASRHACFTSW